MRIKISNLSYPVLFARASLKRDVPIPNDNAFNAVIPCFLRGPH